MKKQIKNIKVIFQALSIQIKKYKKVFIKIILEDYFYKNPLPSIIDYYLTKNRS
jgi:hypothetical protein